MSEQSIRDEIADEIAGVVVGVGYYSMSIGIDAAREAADLILASPAIRRALAEAWDEGFDEASDDLGRSQMMSDMGEGLNPYRATKEEQK